MFTVGKLELPKLLPRSAGGFPVVVVGDSMIRELPSLRAIDIFSFPGFELSRCQQVISQTSHLWSSYQTFILCIGTNEITKCDPSTIVRHFQQLSQTILDIQPQSQIDILSILPRLCDFDHTNSAVKSTNRKLQALCRESSHLNYHDSKAAFLEKGKPNRLCYKKDGLHPNEKGIDYLREVILSISHRRTHHLNRDSVCGVSYGTVGILAPLMMPLYAPSLNHRQTCSSTLSSTWFDPSSREFPEREVTPLLVPGVRAALPIPVVVDGTKSREVVQNSDKITFIKGSGNPASNFFPEDFVWMGLRFSCVEQIYQILKALHCHQNSMAILLSQITDAWDNKQLSKLIHPHPSWHQQKLVVMPLLLDQKFQQSIEFRETLYQSLPGTIVHNVADPLWGRIHLGRISRGVYRGQNVFGLLLQQVRDKYFL